MRWRSPSRPGWTPAARELVRERFAQAIAAGDGERYWPVIAEHIAAGG